MSTLPFDFSGVADPNGVVTVSKQIPVGPLRVAITNFTLRTHNGCHERIHRLRVRVNGDVLYEGDMHDCMNLALRSTQSWRGIVQLRFTASGFDPGEAVRGGGSVGFRTVLF